MDELSLSVFGVLDEGTRYGIGDGQPKGLCDNLVNAQMVSSILQKKFLYEPPHLCTFLWKQRHSKVLQLDV